MKTKNGLFTFVALFLMSLLFTSFISKKQLLVDIWEDLERFHQAIALTFHPAEDGDFEPVKNDSKELVEAAEKLSSSKLPSYFDKNENLKNELYTILEKLVIQTKDLDRLVEEKTATDQELLAQLNALHTTYHHIEGINRQAKEAKK